ncbi:MAG: zinc-binding alcohol dehydrogenase family protein [Tannerellaceae bacterium]|jgi:threonine dehydrogenase-like Zn-dependent dehydrogenase|nr:zinc-binding alcohol dehydrogenase family protein [Tannerellaceae bacterium]
MKTIKILGREEIALTEAPAPALKAGEALLRVEYAGFCGSDLNTYLGKNSMAKMPVVPGHEIGARVLQAGEGAPAHIVEGCACTVNPYTACGICPSCLKGRPNACRDNRTLGVQRDGAMSELIAVPWEKVIADRGISPLHFALVEPLSVGFHAVARAAVTDVDSVAVIGCGMIGMGAILRAALRGACVIALDLDDDKLAVAREFGASFTVKVSEGGVEQRLAEITSGAMPDVCIEASGSPAACLTALACTGFCGRMICIGYAPSEVPLPTKVVVQKELDLRGSRNALPEDFRAVMACLRSNRFPVGKLISAVYPPEQAADAMAKWAGAPSKVFRMMLKFGE